MPKDYPERPAPSPLTTAEAAEICGYASPAGLRKAALEDRVEPLGRRRAGGPYMWDPEEIERFERSRGRGGVDAAEDDVSENLDLYLSTTEAARYCGYRSACSLRKAAFAGKVSAVGRVSTNGTNVWLVRDLWLMLRGRQPPMRDGGSSFARAQLSSVERVYEAERSTKPPVAVLHATKSKTPPVVVVAPVAAKPSTRWYSTREVARKIGWSLARLQRLLRRKQRSSGAQRLVQFKGWTAERTVGGHWRIWPRRPDERLARQR